MAGVRGATGLMPSLTFAEAMVLRLAFGAVLGFAVAIALHWQFSFLAPMLAVQILAGMPIRPGLVQGLAIPLVILVASNAALLVSTLFVDAHAVLFAIVGLVVCWSFYGQRRGAPAIIMLLMQLSFCGVPLMSAVSLDLAQSFADFLQRSSFAAIIVVWTCHALFPSPGGPPGPGPAGKPAGLSPAYAGRVAISDALVLLPLLGAFMLGGDVSNLVILITTISLVREVQPGASGRAALGLLGGNILGGGLAVLVQQVVLLADSLVQFLLIVFLSGLWFASRLVRGGPAAPIFALAFGTFILLLGIAITPLPGGSEASFVIRIVKVVLASVYAVGALSLLAPLRVDPAKR